MHCLLRVVLQVFFVLCMISSIAIGAACLVIYRAQVSNYDTQKEYNSYLNCTVESIESLPADGCNVDLYLLSFCLNPSECVCHGNGTCDGYTTGYYSFNNFFRDACDGIPRPDGYVANQSIHWLKPNITCNIHNTLFFNDSRVRISPLLVPDLQYLLVGIACLVCGIGGPTHMLILCVRDCCVRRRRRAAIWLAHMPRFDGAADGDEEFSSVSDPATQWVSASAVVVGQGNWKEELNPRQGATDVERAAASHDHAFVTQSLEALEGDWTAIDCPVCYSTLADKAEAAWWPCGHVVCAECAVHVLTFDHRLDVEVASGYRCPQCRKRSSMEHIRKLTSCHACPSTAVTVSEAAPRNMEGGPNNNNVNPSGGASRSELDEVSVSSQSVSLHFESTSNSDN